MKKPTIPPSAPPAVTLRRREIKRADGRYLIYYEFCPADEAKKCQS